MKPKGHTLPKSYQAALRRHIRQATSTNLNQARRLGARAVALGLDTLDMALIHERALLPAVAGLSDDAPAASDRIVKRAAKFFVEAVMPIEATHRTALEANGRLCKLNRELLRRTRDLASAGRTLRKEIARRKAAQESLRKAEKESTGFMEESRLMQEQMRLLSRRVLLTQEEERKRISRELHDVVAQMLSGINTRLASLKKDAAANAKGMSRKISNTQRLVEKSVDIVHRFARELHPAVLDDLGLVPAVHAHLKTFAKETGIRVTLSASADVNEINSAKRTALYRVAQEALVNVARHAHAEQVDVSIQKLPNAILMQIKDKNKGFDVEKMWHGKKSRHLGMLGMRERVEMVGGRFTVESAPDQGTTIQAWVPSGRGAGKGRLS